MLLVRDGQKDAIINGNRTGEEGGGVPPTMATCPALLLKAGPAGFCAGARPITRLKRNPGDLRRAVRRIEAGIAE